VLAPDKAQCEECPRKDSKSEDLKIERFYRPHEILIDMEKCLLEQGLLCLGPATRSGCDHACINGNMPCTGCLGPVSRVRDQGAAALSALASSIGANDEEQILAALEGLPDPAGTLYRYTMSASTLFRKRV